MAVEKLEKIARSYFSLYGVHGWDHTIRVRKLALLLAKEEKADFEIVEASALLHDIARGREESGKVDCHAKQAAAESEQILKETDFPQQKIEQVKHCISVHRASKGEKAKTIEAEILQDADQLEVTGALGTARCFYKAGEVNAPMYLPKVDSNTPYKGQFDAALNHLIRKSINLLKPENFNTKTGKMIAKQRHDFTKKFVKQFIEEWNLKK